MKSSTLVGILAALVVIALIIVAIVRRPDRSPDPVSQNPVGQVDTTSNSGTLCYYYEKTTTSTRPDIAWARINVSGMNVTGEYRNIPAEKDSKSGTFSGVVASENAAQGTKTATLTYASMAEGMTNKEDLDIVFSGDSAYALYGEMVQKADGTYGYKDRSKLTPGVIMPNVTCAFLESKV